MAKTMEALQVLERYMMEGGSATLDVMDRLEQEADEVRRCIIDDLNHTFITPIDRLDIYALSRSIDDIVDHSASAVVEREVYEVRLDEYARMFGTNLKNAGKKLYDSLLHFKNRPKLATEDALRSKLLINNMEHLYREAVKDLAENPDIAFIFKMRELYRRLFQVAESIRHSDNILLDIIVKLM